MHKDGWNCIEKSKYLLGKLKVLHKKINNEMPRTNHDNQRGFSDHKS